MILLKQTYIETKGKFEPLKFADKLRNWEAHGFDTPPFNDACGLGIGMTVGSVLCHPLIISAPSLAAVHVWVNNHCNLASNGGVMRSAICGAAGHKDLDLEAVAQVSADICKVTHADPRCVASSVAVSIAAASLLSGSDITTSIHLAEQHSSTWLQRSAARLPKEVCSNLKWCLTALGQNPVHAKAANQVAEVQKEWESSSKTLETSTNQDALLLHIHCHDISALNLENRRTMGFTYFALGSGFWALHQVLAGRTFPDVVREIMIQGGDADTNAAVAGALIGAAVGYAALPKHLISGLRYGAWLNELVDQFLMVQRGAV